MDCRSPRCGWCAIRPIAPCPILVATALRPDGEVSLCGVFRSLWQRPVQLFAMPRLAHDAAEGFRALRRCRDLLGHGFGMHDLGELVGEV